VKQCAVKGAGLQRVFAPSGGGSLQGPRTEGSAAIPGAIAPGSSHLSIRVSGVGAGMIGYFRKAIAAKRPAILNERNRLLSPPSLLVKMIS
jgi:hypothetical protein